MKVCAFMLAICLLLAPAANAGELWPPPESSELDGRAGDRFWVSLRGGFGQARAGRLVDQRYSMNGPAGSQTLGGLSGGGGGTFGYSVEWVGCDYATIVLAQSDTTWGSGLRGCVPGSPDCRTFSYIEGRTMIGGLKLGVPLRWVQPYVLVGPEIHGIGMGGTSSFSSKRFRAGSIGEIGVEASAGVTVFLAPSYRAFLEMSSRRRSFFTYRTPTIEVGAGEYWHRLEVDRYRSTTVVAGLSWSPGESFRAQRPAMKSLMVSAGILVALLAGMPALDPASATGLEPLD